MSQMNLSKLFGVQGLVAVITGGGTGIGLMMTKALEENGAKVYIVGRRLEVLERAAQQAKFGNIIPLQCDVTSKDDILKIVDHITKTDGFVNLVVANSGIQGPGLDNFPSNPSLGTIRDFLWAMDDQSFNDVFRVNNTAVFYTVVAFLPLLEAGNSKGNVEQKSQVIATSSVASFNRAAFSGFAYSASKAGTTHMMKQFSTMLTPYGIRSNIIAPGLYPSEMTDDALAYIRQKNGGEIPEAMVPLRKEGTLEDMAAVILFLASRAGAYLSGTVLLTDGGRLGIVPSTY